MSIQTQKNKGLDTAEITRKSNQRGPKPSKRIVTWNVTNVKLLLGDFDDAWRAFTQDEYSTGDLVGFLAWFHEELQTAGAFGGEA